MTMALHLVISFVFFKLISGCTFEDVTEIRSFPNMQDMYSPSRGYYYASSETITLYSTITCSNINSIQEIVYTYQEHDYEQFLKIADSNISTLQPLDFSHFSTITKLYLSETHIGTILPGTFTGLANLKELYLDGNELTRLSNGVYNSLHKLEILDLRNNKIYTVDEYSLMGVASLEKLYLKHNKISEIEEEIFETSHRLKYLDVSQNPLRELSLENLWNIDTLIVSETSLKSIADLSNLTIKNFNLSHCRISEVDFLNFPKSDVIDLSNNKIQSIRNEDILDGGIIKLDHNEIKTIQGMFNRLSKFSASYNKLEIVKKYFEGAISPLTLDFSHNRISKVENNSFQDLSNLEILNLQHNNISQIDPILFWDLARLAILDLSYNQIGDFLYGTFDSLINLEVLDISHNQLLDLHQYVFTSLAKLQNLYFDNNRISFFHAEDLNHHLPLLLTISLDGNSWNCKDLVKIERGLQSSKVKILPGDSYDVENFRGIACFNLKGFATSPNTSSLENIAQDFQKAINTGVQNSKLERFLNEDFEKSKFAQYFDNDYSKSNFKYLSNYKFAVMKPENLNNTKVERLTGLQVAPVEINNNILIFCDVLLTMIVILLLFIVYFMFNHFKQSRIKYKPDECSQMELC